MRIVLCYPVESQHVSRIAAAAPGAEIVDAGQDRINDELLNADVYCGHAKTPVDWERVVRLGRLQWIQSSAAGMDHCLTPPVIASQIVVSSASGVLADQVADHGMALLLATLRSLRTFFHAQNSREFIRRPTRDLCGATVLIVGFGGNGRRLAEVLAPFRTSIFATDCYPVDKPSYVTRLEHADNLDELLPQADVVILAAPLNDDTIGMMDARRFSLMREGAVLVNMARGQLIEENSFEKALITGHLGGAAIDVTCVEPLPVESPLWEIPNLLITPHVGGQKASRIDDMTELFCENLRRFLRGQRLINQLTEKEEGFPRPDDALWKLRAGV